MAHFVIYVDDPIQYRKDKFERSVRHHMKGAEGDALAVMRLQRHVEKAVTAQLESDLKEPGELICEPMSDECPEGLPNCRDCGDPAFAASCAAAGHCPDCGTKHGITPQGLMAQRGAAARIVDPEKAKGQWDRSARKFQGE